jgi:hypothetical protein
MLLVSLLFLNPAFAAEAAAAPASAEELRAVIQQRSGNLPRPIRKILSFLRKLMLGVNAKGSYRNWQAGDTRGELAFILNGVTMAGILGIGAFIGQLFAIYEEKQAMAKMKKAVHSEKEYRENMYFEAVENILKKMAEPKLKGSVKANLAKQLQELDPDNRIRKFLEGGERPDLSKTLEQSRSVHAGVQRCSGAVVQWCISDTFSYLPHDTFSDALSPSLPIFNFPLPIVCAVKRRRRRRQRRRRAAPR